MPQSEEHITNNGVGQQAQNQRSEAPPPTTGAEDHLAQPTQQHALAVDGPGTLRRAGPRHDNDKVCIEDIQILPTAQEVASLENSYLPFTLDNAAHHHPPGSPERLLDIHFRLLRAEFAEPLRRGMRALLSEVQANASNTSTTNGASQLSRLLARGGGQFKVEKSMTAYQLWGTGRLDMVLGHDPKYGTLLSISFESQVTREEMVRKSLCYGGTIAVVTSTKGRTTFAWGVNRSNDERNGEKSRHSVKVQLLRSEEMVSVLESGRRGDFQLLFEVPVRGTMRMRQCSDCCKQDGSRICHLLSCCQGLHWSTRPAACRCHRTVAQQDLPSICRDCLATTTLPAGRRPRA